MSQPQGFCVEQGQRALPHPFITRQVDACGRVWEPSGADAPMERPQEQDRPSPGRAFVAAPDSSGPPIRSRPWFCVGFDAHRHCRSEQRRASPLVPRCGHRLVLSRVLLMPALSFVLSRITISSWSTRWFYFSCRFLPSHWGGENPSPPSLSASQPLTDVLTQTSMLPGLPGTARGTRPGLGWGRGPHARPWPCA